MHVCMHVVHHVHARVHYARKNEHVYSWESWRIYRRIFLFLVCAFIGYFLTTSAKATKIIK